MYKCVSVKRSTGEKVSRDMVDCIVIRESLDNHLHNWLVIRLISGELVELSPDLVADIRRTRTAEGRME
jgi:hypothetical protein